MVGFVLELVKPASLDRLRDLLVLAFVWDSLLFGLRSTFIFNFVFLVLLGGLC